MFYKERANKRASERLGRAPLPKYVMKTLLSGVGAPLPWQTRKITSVGFVHETDLKPEPAYRMVVGLKTTNLLTGHEDDQTVGTVRTRARLEAEWLREIAGTPEIIEQANAINEEAGRLYALPVSTFATVALAAAVKVDKIHRLLDAPRV